MSVDADGLDEVSPLAMGETDRGFTRKKIEGTAVDDVAASSIDNQDWRTMKRGRFSARFTRAEFITGHDQRAYGSRFGEGARSLAGSARRPKVLRSVDTPLSGWLPPVVVLHLVDE